MDVMKRLMGPTLAALAVVGLVLAAFMAGGQVRAALGWTPDAALADDAAGPATVVVTDQTGVIDGQTVGEVLINGEVIIRLRVAMGGWTPIERAQVVGGRLQTWVAGERSAADLTVAEESATMATIRASGSNLVTVGEGDAAPIDSTPLNLANDWRNNILIALGIAPGPGETPGTGEGTDQGTEPTEWVPSEPYSDKIVPILSVLEGVRIGAARVSGPGSKVDTVKGVAQLETHFKDYLEIDLYVPITTETPGRTLDRVQGVGVNGLGDLRL